LPQHHSNRRSRAGRIKAAAAALLTALLAGLLLTACGGSSKGTSSTSSTTSTSSAATSSASSTSPTGSRGQFGARAAALRTCLEKEGITLPKRKPGGQNGKRPGTLFGLGGAGRGLQLPKGISRAQLQAAFKKCGGNLIRSRRLGAARNPQRLAKFAACMRQNGINLPAPNTSGKGPVFNTKGIDTTSAAFRRADAKCVRELIPPGGAPGGPGGGPAG
jgi:hypothetical protein